MKVLVVGPSPEKSKGGMATVIKDIRDDAQLNRDFDIDVFESYVDGNKVFRFVYSQIAFIQFKRIYKDYDLFHIHMASYGSTFRKAKYVEFLKNKGKKVIVHIHGAAFMDFYANLNSKKQNYVVSVLEKSDLVIALSNEWKRRFESSFGLKNCVSIPNGINTILYKNAMSDALNNNVFLFLGRLGKRKGTYDLVDAVTILRDEYPDVKVYMAGDGDIDEVAEIVSSRELNSNIEIVGWVDQFQKVELLKKCATLVLPSYNEGLPMAILEAMAAGKVIISTTVGAIPEVVGEDNGILITPGDVNALSDAMKRVMNSPEYVHSCIHENIAKIDNEYSMNHMHELISEYYKENE